MNLLINLKKKNKQKIRLCSHNFISHITYFLNLCEIFLMINI